MEQKISVKNIQESDYPFLREMLYEAIYLPDGAEPYDKSIIDNPRIAVYTKNWGKPNDFGLILLVNNTPVGAVWGRLFTKKDNSFGFISSKTPEIAIALKKGYRNKGYGSFLLRQFFQTAKKLKFTDLSLSVEKNNHATNLYKRLGFKIVKESSDDYIMKITL